MGGGWERLNGKGGGRGKRRGGWERLVEVMSGLERPRQEGEEMNG